MQTSTVGADILSHCLLLNARSLKNKLPDLHFTLDSLKPACVFICETWLDSSVSDALIDPSGCYNVYRHDRAHRVGGGVMVLICKTYMSYQVPIPRQFSGVEVECCDILGDGTTVRIILVYRPPEFNAVGREYMVQLIDCLQYLYDDKKTILLLGDLNVPYINWENKSSIDDHIHSAFLDFCNDHGMDQFVTEPTRNTHILDIVLCNDPLIVSSVSVDQPFSTADHCSVCFDLVLSAKNKVKHGCNSFDPVYDFNNYDVQAVNSALLFQPFVFSTPIDSVEEVWKQFIDPVNSIIKSHVPLKVRLPKRSE